LNVVALNLFSNLKLKLQV